MVVGVCHTTDSAFTVSIVLVKAGMGSSSSMVGWWKYLGIILFSPFDSIFRQSEHGGTGT